MATIDTKHNPKIYAVNLNYKRQWFFSSQLAAVHALTQYCVAHKFKICGNTLRDPLHCDLGYHDVSFEKIEQVINNGEFLFIVGDEYFQELFVEELPLDTIIEFPYQLEKPL